MKYKRKTYEEQDFIRIRDFLKLNFKEMPEQNWLIDRWNFARYFGQTMHNSFDTWPNTVGVWEDDNKELVAVVHTEENRHGKIDGQVYIQLSNKPMSEDFLTELIDYAEDHLASESDKVINIRLSKDSVQLRNILEKRDYTLLDWSEPVSEMEITQEYAVDLPEGFKISEGKHVSNDERGFAHGKAFGYYKNDAPDDDDAKRCYEKVIDAPDYNEDLDLVVLDENNEIASFVTVWYDDVNDIGILEPVGTVPKYRKLGLAKALIHEGINRVKKMGAKKMAVGSDQKLYQSLGFKVKYKKDIYSKKLG